MSIHRRTLKKRIRRALNFSAFIPVVFLSAVIICLLFLISQAFALYQVESISSVIQKEINSGNVLKTLQIDDISLLDAEDDKTKIWVDEMSQNYIFQEIFSDYDKEISSVYITIELGDQIIFTNEEETQGHLADFYKKTKVTKPILDKEGQTIGTITVQSNPMILTTLVFTILIIIIIFSLLALLISKIFGLFLIIPIINPIRQLEKKVKAIAEDDIDTAINTELILKRPLKEIESLATSTNGIIRKLHNYSDTLESQKQMLANQKDVLENQNAELEMQNEALMESKQQIQNQQGQLIQSEKMASVGMLTAAITHEINTPIGAINSNAQLEEMLLTQLINHPTIQQSEELTEIFAQLKEVNDVNLVACRRIVEIIKSLKTFSRLDQADFQETDLNDGIKSVLVLTNNLTKRRITIHEEYGALPMVKCFPGQLNQVFMNIIVNATQAIDGEGEIFIRTYQQERDIIISIRDTGNGIKEEDIPKLFNPGYTTKGVGVGLGLGLYLSYNIIENHKGEISVVSEYGKGAEFIIRIPMNSDKT